MTNKIGGYDNRPVLLSTGGAVQRTRSDGAAKQPTSSTDPGPVQITDQARQLGMLEQTLQQLPAFDELRVSALRQAIDEGTYEIAPDRIADRLLKMEWDLRA